MKNNWETGIVVGSCKSDVRVETYDLPAAPVKWYNIELPEWVFKAVLFTLFIMVVTLICMIFGEEVATLFFIGFFISFIVSSL